MKSFAETVNELWSSLRLPPPDISGGNSVSLSVDGVDVGLRETRDAEHVLVRSTIGRLSDDPRERSDQVNWILKANLAFMMNSSACVRLDEAANGSVFVVAENIHSCRNDDIDSLTRRIEDVISTVEMYHGRLNVRTRTSSPGKPASAPDTSGEDTIIFRP